MRPAAKNILDHLLKIITLKYLLRPAPTEYSIVTIDGPLFFYKLL